MKRIALGVCALCVAALATAPALAQDKKPPAGPAAQPAAPAVGSGGATRGVITLAEVTITAASRSRSPRST
jgi:predicted secreted protein